jgi:hypothetical protein
MKAELLRLGELAEADAEGDEVGARNGDGLTDEGFADVVDAGAVETEDVGLRVGREGVSTEERGKETSLKWQCRLYASHNASLLFQCSFSAPSKLAKRRRWLAGKPSAGRRSHSCLTPPVRGRWLSSSRRQRSLYRPGACVDPTILHFASWRQRPSRAPSCPPQADARRQLWRCTDVVGSVYKVDEVGAEIVGEFGEEGLGLRLGERAHCEGERGAGELC